jgi:hypothetical protein
MVVPISSILKQILQYLTISDQVFLSGFMTLCITLESLSQGKINVHDKLQGGEENNGNLIQNTVSPAKIQAA